MRRHNIPLETPVAFADDPRAQIAIVSDYQELLGPCKEPCDHGHDDCYEEPYICVRYEVRTAMPLSKLRWIFENHVGRKPTAFDKGEE